MLENRKTCGKCVPQVNSHAGQDDDRPIRSNVLKRVNGWKRRIEFLIDEHHVHDHSRAGEGYDEMNYSQSDADSERHGTYDRTPHQVTLMHLTEQCEHQQPWRDRKSTRLNSSHMSSSYAVFCLK